MMSDLMGKKNKRRPLRARVGARCPVPSCAAVHHAATPLFVKPIKTDKCSHRKLSQVAGCSSRGVPDPVHLLAFAALGHPLRKL